jgi:two-component system chemotaxis response regulator CheB
VPNIIAIGASAGGVDALRQIVRPLPADLQAAIFVVMHISPLAPSVLPQILNDAGAMTAAAAVEGERIQPGRIYVAPSDHHMLIEPGVVRLTRGPRENRFRPAIDPLFRTVARAYGSRVLGIVLTGLLGDGAVGLQVIKSERGRTMVQEPGDAMFSSMPLTAMRSTSVDFVLPAAEMPARIVDLVREPWKDMEPARAGELARIDETPEGEKLKQDERVLGKPSAFSCPDCTGTLWELQDGDVLRFRCRVGHAYSADGVRAGYSDSVEAALWSAVRALEESAALERRLAEQASGRGSDAVAARFNDVAVGREQQAALIREMLLSGKKADEPEIYEA